MSNASFELVISVVSSCRGGAGAVKVNATLVTMFPVIVGTYWLAQFIVLWLRKEIPLQLSLGEISFRILYD